jgi:hypothetical protein
MSDGKVTLECPRCGSHLVRYPDTHLPTDPATCAICGNTYAYGRLLEAATRRVLRLVAAERHASERVLEEVNKVVR